MVLLASCFSTIDAKEFRQQHILVIRLSRIGISHNLASLLSTQLAGRTLMPSLVQDEGKGIVLDQFGNLANPLAHYKGTGPEVWKQTKGKVTHFVSSMGTTGTIMGTSRYLKEQNPNVQIVGLQPKEGSAIAGIRRWPKEYLPTIFQVCVGPLSMHLPYSLDGTAIMAFTAILTITKVTR